jgi:hypothetical protein
MKNLINIGAWVLGIVLFFALIYGLWQVGRHLNYSWSYEDMVQETICETVKHEHLKNPEACK